MFFLACFLVIMFMAFLPLTIRRFQGQDYNRAKSVNGEVNICIITLLNQFFIFYIDISASNAKRFK